MCESAAKEYRVLGVRLCAQSLKPNTLFNARRRGGFLERCYAGCLAKRRARVALRISDCGFRNDGQRADAALPVKSQPNEALARIDQTLSGEE